MVSGSHGGEAEPLLQRCCFSKQSGLGAVAYQCFGFVEWTVSIQQAGFPNAPRLWLVFPATPSSLTESLGLNLFGTVLVDGVFGLAWATEQDLGQDRKKLHNMVLDLKARSKLDRFCG